MTTLKTYFNQFECVHGFLLVSILDKYVPEM